MKDRGANGELSHFQRGPNDGLDVADVNLAGEIQSAACAAFDHIAWLAARGGFH